MSTLTKSPIVGALLALGCSCSGDSKSPAAPPETQSPPNTRVELPSTFKGKIVFVRAAGGANTLMIMEPDASGTRSLAVNGVSPDVSPDGRKVVYHTPSGGIAVLDLATRKETVLATRLAASPKWSPDGTKILFWSDRSGTKELWTMHPDGTNARRLSDGGDGYHEGAWSPDGARIVFRRVVPGSGGGDLWMMNADGSSAKIFYAGNRMDSDPRWSPDGNRIAFVRVVDREPTGTTSAIFVINADGSNLLRATYDAAGDWAPRWSPDGSAIVFFGFHAGPDDADIFAVRPDGTGRRLVPGGATYDHGAVFGPR